MMKKALVTRLGAKLVLATALVAGATPFALVATQAGASPTQPTGATAFPIHPSTFNAKLNVVTAQQEANSCRYPTGKIGGKFYCGGYVVNTSLTFNATLNVVTAQQEANSCQYPTGTLNGKFYCGGYVRAGSIR